MESLMRNKSILPQEFITHSFKNSTLFTSSEESSRSCLRSELPTVVDPSLLPGRRRQGRPVPRAGGSGRCISTAARRLLGGGGGGDVAALDVTPHTTLTHDIYSHYTLLMRLSR